MNRILSSVAAIAATLFALSPAARSQQLQQATFPSQGAGSAGATLQQTAHSNSASDSTVSMEVLVTQVNAADNLVSVISDDDHIYKARVQTTEIIVPGAGRAGTLSDLSRGMRIRVIGAFSGTDGILADRIRVLSGNAPSSTAPAVPTAAIAAAIAVPSAAAAASVAVPTAAVAASAVRVAALAAVPAPVDLSTCTGILIDAGSSDKILRSPAPCIYGPDMTLLYPDRSHVPSADDVQTESIVRYYRSMDDAEQGVSGGKPLVLAAQSVVGCASDSIVLTADEAAEFKALDARLHFTRTWKVGFLIPADR